jgi:nitroimidazol reductase NimA-like FMN-containing flavoprotein (pyridoxamine 5'-phosphate oxidase superfamily)
MRRKEQEITNRTAIEEIIRRSPVCRLALSEDGCPYIVPLCFGYRDKALYFHTAQEGKKLRILKKNNRVCFEFDIIHELVRSEEPCKWGMKYLSVVGFGHAMLIEDLESKKRALDIIMQHYGAPCVYREEAVHRAEIIKVEIEHMTGKSSRL